VPARYLTRLQDRYSTPRETGERATEATATSHGSDRGDDGLATIDRSFGRSSRGEGATAVRGYLQSKTKLQRTARHKGTHETNTSACIIRIIRNHFIPNPMPAASHHSLSRRRRGRFAAVVSRQPQSLHAALRLLLAVGSGAVLREREAAPPGRERLWPRGSTVRAARERLGGRQHVSRRRRGAVQDERTRARAPAPLLWTSRPSSDAAGTPLPPRIVELARSGGFGTPETGTDLSTSTRHAARAAREATIENVPDETGPPCRFSASHADHEDSPFLRP
jgi:hypothetical protein